MQTTAITKEPVQERLKPCLLRRELLAQRVLMGQVEDHGALPNLLLQRIASRHRTTNLDPPRLRAFSRFSFSVMVPGKAFAAAFALDLLLALAFGSAACSFMTPKIAAKEGGAELVEETVEAAGRSDSSLKAARPLPVVFTLQEAEPVRATRSRPSYFDPVKHQNRTDSGQSGASSSGCAGWWRMIASILRLSINKQTLRIYVQMSG